ncbi:hypothetical protein N7519_003180 [Penicillium mononematosum]|uniref:uncharacterized protein n=1 Tax=Penicillium mononematosum TaxID=268346 RepID=UPI002549438C|nr:uncharacterized protein N7519_003180 [Penicillium mononematosum]KAJ6188272.1 hypothetical protein N7519_003180 [Penicillium mononematosum]
MLGIIAAISRTKSAILLRRRAVILGEADGIPASPIDPWGFGSQPRRSKGGHFVLLGASGTQVQELSWEGLKSDWACTIPV